MTKGMTIGHIPNPWTDKGGKNELQKGKKGGNPLYHRGYPPPIFLSPPSPPRDRGYLRPPAPTLLLRWV